MSWDVVVGKFPDGVAPNEVTELPALGDKLSVMGRLREIFPKAELIDSAGEGYLQGPGYVLEFYLEDEDPIRAITVCLRGGDEAFGALKHLCDQTGWKASDASEEEMIDLASPEAQASFHEWIKIRDSIVDGDDDDEVYDESP